MSTTTTLSPAPDHSRPFPFLALLWKEWRQQRWVILALAALPSAHYLSTFPFLDEKYRGGVLVVTVLGGLIVPVILGAAAFCGEQDEGTADYLYGLPAGALRVFCAKLLSALLGTTLTTLLLILAILAVCPVISGVEAKQSLETIRELRGLKGVAGGMILISLCLVPALMTTWVRRTLPCIFSSIAVFGLLCGIVVVLTWPYAEIYLEGTERGSFVNPRLPDLRWLVYWPFCTSFVLLTVAAFVNWAWGRLSRPWGRRLLRAGTLLIVLIAVAIAPFAGRYVWFTYFAGVKGFQGQYTSRWNEGGVSAAGRWIAFRCACREWRGFSRTALVDVETGETKWLMKNRPTSPFYEGCSPSGDKLLLHAGKSYWPFSRDRDIYSSEVFLANPATGRWERLADSFPTFIEALRSTGYYPMSWMNNDMVVLTRREGLVFADFARRVVRNCALDPADVDPRERYYFPMAAPHGMYAMAAREWDETRRTATGPVRILRFTPDLSTPEVFAPNLGGEPQNADLRDVGRHKALLLVRTYDNYEDGSSSRSNPTLWYVAEFGATAALTPVHSAPRGDKTVAYPVSFVLDDSCLLFQSPDSLRLLRLEDWSASSIPVAVGRLEGWRLRYCLPTPSRSHAAVLLSRGEGPDDRKEDRRLLVVDLASGATTNFEGLPDPHPQWLDDERLLVALDKELWAVNRDGSDRRLLFEEK